MTDSSSPDRADAAWTIVEKARAARGRGDQAAALSLYREAERAFGPDPAGRAHCLRHIGDLARELGRIDDARGALDAAERLYRHEVDDRLGLANSVRLRALIDGDPARWRDARKLYAPAAAETGLDLAPALEECDRHLAAR